MMTPDQLKEWCEVNDVTQKKLSEMLGVAENTVSRWILGERTMPPLLPRALRDVEAELRRVRKK